MKTSLLLKGGNDMPFRTIYPILESEILRQEKAKKFLVEYFKQPNFEVRGCSLELSPSNDIFFEYGQFNASINFDVFYEWSKSYDEIDVKAFENYLITWMKNQIQ